MTRIPTYDAAVQRSEALTPRMQRVTIGGDALAGFASCGLPDERIKLLLPAPGQERPVLPVVDEQGFHYPPGATKPLSRSFTVRRFDPDALELDLDIALHDGPAARWALGTRPGDRVGIAGPVGGYAPSPDADLHLLAGDDAALPAIATILERLPADARAQVLVEVENKRAELALPSRADVRIVWLHRHGRVPGEDGVLAGAVRALDWPPGRVDVWAAGEALAMRAIRRHIRDELGLERERFHVAGYWRHRLDEDAAIVAHAEAYEAALAAGAGADELDDAGIY